MPQNNQPGGRIGPLVEFLFGLVAITLLLGLQMYMRMTSWR